jgi:hypothetical protein
MASRSFASRPTFYPDGEIIEDSGPRRDGAEHGSRDEISNREWIAHIDADQEVKRLQERVSLLAMQKDYWRQRSAEHLNACRAAEAEVTRLNEALADSKARLEVTRDVGEPRLPLTVLSVQTFSDLR